MAFDCGPGNALMDDFMLRRKSEAYDRDGILAREGSVHEAMIKEWMRHPFFNQAPPKSLDRDAWDVSAVESLSDEDGMATLCEFTAKAIQSAIKHCPKPPKTCYISGGGRHNSTLMERLDALLGCVVEPVEAAGARGDAMEAEGFAYFAVRSVLGLPISEPGTTGVSKPMSGGVLHKA